jgi:hypothetical protein
MKQSQGLPRRLSPPRKDKNRQGHTRLRHPLLNLRGEGACSFSKQADLCSACQKPRIPETRNPVLKQTDTAETINTEFLTDTMDMGKGYNGARQGSPALALWARLTRDLTGLKVVLVRHKP